MAPRRQLDIAIKSLLLSLCKRLRANCETIYIIELDDVITLIQGYSMADKILIIARNIRN